MEKKEFIEAGRIVNTHGIAGEVKIEVWLDSPEFMKKFKRVFIGERELRVMSGRVHKGFLIAKLEGVDDINAAMPLKGKTLHIKRADARLPILMYSGLFANDIFASFCFCLSNRKRACRLYQLTCSQIALYVGFT